MAAYDQFLNNPHSELEEKLLISNANKLLKFIFKKYINKEENAKILEIGPGKGYFYKANLQGGYGEYWAMDRNPNMLKNLSIEEDRTIIGSLPNIETEEKFDLIFVGYVIEHLGSGIELFECLTNLKNHLRENGVIILQFPDCMKLGMEFYNIDYTHMRPTTKRNVNQAVIDSGLEVIKSVDLSGILYTKVVDSRILYYIKRLIFSLYNYRLCSAILYPICRIPVWRLNNVFWRAYALLKEPNVMFICKDRD